jgi:hypothetical protein
MSQSVINLDAGISYSVYSMIEIMKGQRPDGNLIYEIHEDLGPGEPDPEFKRRTSNYYMAFADAFLVDQWATNTISYTLKVDSTWFVAEQMGSNTYTGTGPTSVIDMRRYCAEAGIKILYIEKPLKEWLDEVLDRKKNPASEQNKPSPVKIYRQANYIISRCGEGLSRVIKTAQKLHENNFRDLFLAAFHSHRDFVVEGEALNREGFTDLKVTHRETDATFIYEFKIQDGKTSTIQKGLTQITDRYLAANNQLNGLIFINTESRNINDLKAAIVKEISDIGLTVSPEALTAPGAIMVARHSNVRDSAIECTLTIFVFDIQR